MKALSPNNASAVDVSGRNRDAGGRFDKEFSQPEAGVTLAENPADTVYKRYENLNQFAFVGQGEYVWASRADVGETGAAFKSDGSNPWDHLSVSISAPTEAHHNELAELDSAIAAFRNTDDYLNCQANQNAAAHPDNSSATPYWQFNGIKDKVDRLESVRRTLGQQVSAGMMMPHDPSPVELATLHLRLAVADRRDTETMNRLEANLHRAKAQQWLKSTGHQYHEANGQPVIPAVIQAQVDKDASRTKRRTVFRRLLGR